MKFSVSAALCLALTPNFVAQISNVSTDNTYNYDKCSGEAIRMSPADLETRLAALEAEVAKLKHFLPPAIETPWWAKIANTFADDPVYEEAMQHGHQYRQSLKQLSDVESES